jgi:hypothetical protein
MSGNSPHGGENGPWEYNALDNFPGIYYKFRKFSSFSIHSSYPPGMNDQWQKLPVDGMNRIREHM